MIGRVAVLCAAGVSVAQAAPGEVRYRVDVASGAASHRVEVALTVGDAPSPLSFSMPTWTPGAYERRDWGRNVTALEATGSFGRGIQPLSVTRVSPSEWRVAGHPAGARVTIRYQVFADLLSDDASQVDRHHAYLNGTSIFLRAHGCEARPQHVALTTPFGTRIATALDPDGDELVAADYEALMDAPIEVGTFTEATVPVDGRPFRVVIDAGPLRKRDANEPVPKKLLAAVASIAHAESALVGAPPYPRYLILIHLADGPARIAALEHRASTSIVVPRRSLLDDEAYSDLLYVIAHELFHAWNARRLRPAELMSIDFDRPVPSRALWITEGLTEYYAHRAMRASGLWSREQYLRQVEDELSRPRLDPTTAALTLEEQAELAWHAPDAGAIDPDAYYARGHQVALGLDLAIRARSNGAHSLDDVVRRLLADAESHGGAIAVDTDTLARVAGDVAGVPLAGKIGAWVRRPGDGSIDEELAAFGLKLEVTDGPREQLLGITVEAADGSFRIAAVSPDGAAARAGVRTGDRIVAVDGSPPPSGWPANAKLAAGQIVILEAVRATHRVLLPVAIESHRSVTCHISPIADAPKSARDRRESWLGRF
jgi:predicted metalloprotease with PDZ domain